MKNVAILASGGGSNAGALIAAQKAYASYRVELIIVNVEGAGALTVASEAGVAAILLPSRGVTREDHAGEVLRAIGARTIDIVCLAGYTRILPPSFIASLSRPLLNIHPSLLPAFPGMHAQRKALEAGVRWSGATVHFVDQGLDTGPIILQEPVSVEAGDTEESLSARILSVEHRIYPQALDLVAREQYELRGRVVALHRSAQPAEIRSLPEK